MIMRETLRLMRLLNGAYDWLWWWLVERRRGRGGFRDSE